MKNRNIIYLLFCIPFLFTSCKKDSEIDPLSNVILQKNGVIRVECNECTLNYTILNDNYTVKVKNNEDVQFNYVSDFELKINITSSQTQNIRLAIFDAYGRTVSNQLSSITAESNKAGSFKISIE